MDLTIILTIGKYAMLVAIYAFVLVVFRGIIKQLAAESSRGQEAVAAERSRREPRRRVRVRPAPKRDAVVELSPAPPVREPRAVPEAAPEPKSEPEAAPSPAPEPKLEPPVEPAAASLRKPPAGRAARIDLLREADEPPVAQPPASPKPEPAPEPPAAQEVAAPHLLVLESADESLEAGETIPLSAAVTIGRSEENSLQVTDRFISSRHALICLRDGRRILVDRGSTNGTFVNGDRVEEEVELSDGDRIALGNTVVEYHVR